MLAKTILSTSLLLLITAAAFCQQRTDKIVNGGFERLEAERIPGWEKLPWGERAHTDTHMAHDGTQSVRVTPRHAVRSKLTPYPGGRIRVTGWMKTRDVTKGEKNWHKAALQLISYNDQRRSVGHTDIALIDGTTEWQQYTKTTLLSRRVAYVSIHCHLWGAKTRGTAWFDDIRMEFLDEDADLPQRDINLKEATVTVDFNSDAGSFRHLWIGSDVSYMDRVVSDTQVNAMKHAREYGFRYIRMHDCIHNPGIYSEDEDGTPIYNWEKFDRRINTVVNCGMWPVIVLESVPPEIATDDTGLGWQNRYPPDGPDGYRRWQELIRRVVAHCKHNWGDDIHNWYFEVWNEPNAKGYFYGTLQDYLKIYDHAVAGATSADPDIRIGGPGGAGTEWIEPFLKHCKSGNNHATGETGCRVDFLSWHIYTIGIGIPVFDKLDLSISRVRDILSEFSQYKDIPTLITEWGCASSPHPVHNRPYDAAFRVMAVRRFMDHDITLALPFSLGAGPPHAHEGFQGSLAMFTKTTIPKPSFRAFELLHRMKGRRVKCKSSNAPIGGLACISDKGNSAWITLYNLIEDHAHDPYNTAVSINISGLNADDWSCKKTTIATGVCDPYLLWKEMGSPKQLTQQQENRLLNASQLPETAPVAIADGTIKLQMPGFSVLQLQLTRR